jgi:hypothetical protein
MVEERKKAHPSRLAEEHIPASDDPRWQVWAARITAVLKRPMTVRELRTLIPEFSLAVLSNTLAWMDLRSIIIRERTAAGPVLW